MALASDALRAWLSGWISATDQSRVTESVPAAPLLTGRLRLSNLRLAVLLNSNVVTVTVPLAVISAQQPLRLGPAGPGPAAAAGPGDY